MQSSMLLDDSCLCPLFNQPTLGAENSAMSLPKVWLDQSNLQSRISQLRRGHSLLLCMSICTHLTSFYQKVHAATQEEGGFSEWRQLLLLHMPKYIFVKANQIVSLRLSLRRTYKAVAYSVRTWFHLEMCKQPWLATAVQSFELPSQLSFGRPRIVPTAESSACYFWTWAPFSPNICSGYLKFCKHGPPTLSPFPHSLIPPNLNSTKPQILQ